VEKKEQRVADVAMSIRMLVSNCTRSMKKNVHEKNKILAESSRKLCL
jgi:hypothetical protein